VEAHSQWSSDPGGKSSCKGCWIAADCTTEAVLREGDTARYVVVVVAMAVGLEAVGRYTHRHCQLEGDAREAAQAEERSDLAACLLLTAAVVCCY